MIPRGAATPRPVRQAFSNAVVSEAGETRGIGPWSGDRAAIFYFQEPDIWPDRAAAAGNAFRRFLREGQPVAETTTRFSSYRSFLALRLWRWVDGVL